MHIQQTSVIVLSVSKKRTTKLETLNPSICIGSRLKMLSRNVENIYRKHLKPHNITLSQLSILFFIAKNNRVRQKEIGKYFSLERSTVSRDLTRLIKNNLINKDGTETRSAVTVTETGLNLLEDIIPSWKLAHEESSALLGENVTTNISEVVNKFRG